MVCAMCEQEGGIDHLMHQVRENIDTYGWHATAVFGDQDEPWSCGFAYTTGLIERNHPEIIVFSLPPQTAHALLSIAYEMIKSGRTFVDGEEVTEIANLPVYFRSAPADNPNYSLGVGIRFYDQPTFPVLQMVLPDKHGKWPWEPDVDHRFAVTQQLLLPVE